MPNDTAPTQTRTIKRRRPATTAAQAIANADKALGGPPNVGRPLTYDPSLCDRAIALGAKGKHWAAIARAFNVDRATLYSWAADFPEFSNALSRARTLSQAWWEDHGQKNLKSKHYQAQVSRTIMAAQFEDYREAKQSQGPSSFDLGAFVGALAQQLAKPAAIPGDDAKPVEPLPVVPVNQAKDR